MNCIERNGEILEYHVTYQAVGYQEPSLSLTVFHPDRSLFLNNLIPRTNYNLQVAAKNTNRTGPSSELTVSTGDVEGKLELIIHDCSSFMK